ncbi:hypothetical protein FOA52_009624 [Chlamydomonas sp. UWO 241]|nr:hypothetical protein FOA52_009624 [Chlamydomonas sp. UWO 241]
MGVNFKGHFKKHAQAWFLLASSLVVVIAAAKTCDDTNMCSGVQGWAVGASVISLGLTAVYLIAAFFLEGACDKVASWLATLIALWWIPGAFILTFNGPFAIVGNGYFGAWLCLFFSLQWFQTAGSSAVATWFTGGDGANGAPVAPPASAGAGLKEVVVTMADVEGAKAKVKAKPQAAAGQQPAETVTQAVAVAEDGKVVEPEPEAVTGESTPQPWR